MAELIATGTTDVYSSEFTLNSTDAVTLSLKSASDPNIPQGAQAVILYKTSASTFLRIGFLDVERPHKCYLHQGLTR